MCYVQQLRRPGVWASQSTFFSCYDRSMFFSSYQSEDKMIAKPGLSQRSLVLARVAAAGVQGVLVFEIPACCFLMVFS